MERDLGGRRENGQKLTSAAVPAGAEKVAALSCLVHCHTRLQV